MKTAAKLSRSGRTNPFGKCTVQLSLKVSEYEARSTKAMPQRLVFRKVSTTVFAWRFCTINVNSLKLRTPGFWMQSKNWWVKSTIPRNTTARLL